MKRIWKVTVIGAVMLSLVLVMAACTNNSQSSTASDQINGQQAKNIGDNHEEDKEDLADPLRIPSADGEKKETTNEYGTTSKGRGNNIYSSIGTSGIQEGGVSSYFESILKGEGITGVKVFVVDDAVVLARNKQETTSHAYDNMQDKVLRGTKGKTAKQQPKQQQEDEDNDNSLDSLNQAKEILNNVFNGDIKMLTVTDTDAVDLIKDIKADIQSSDYEKASNQMTELLKMAD